MKWNVSKGTPLDFEAYFTKLGLDQHEPLTKINWAHYVLGTNSKMKWLDIRNRYKKLVSEFHTDRNKSARALEITQKSNDAYETLKKSFRNN